MVVEALVQFDYDWLIASRFNFASVTGQLKLTVEAVGSGSPVETTRQLFHETASWTSMDSGSARGPALLSVSMIADPSKTYIADVSASGDVYAGGEKHHGFSWAHAFFVLEANVQLFRIWAP